MRLGKGGRLGAVRLSCAMIWRLIPLMLLAACSTYPVVHWPAGPDLPTPALVPMADLALGPAPTAEARGAALAAQAAALKQRAADIQYP